MLHDEIRRPVRELSHVVHFHGVLAPDLDDRFPLAEKPRHALGVLRALRVQELDRDFLFELQVRRRDDRPHPPTPSTRSTRYFPTRISPACGIPGSSDSGAPFITADRHRRSWGRGGEP